ncbi:MAG: FAD-binding protein [Candidatus Bathyarchaeia archaeon]
MGSEPGIGANVLIVGGGLGGLSAAHRLNELGVSSIIISSKSPLGYGGSTYYSQGAFRCPVGGYSIDDHIRDTLEGGRRINRPFLVRMLVEGSLGAIRALGELAGVELRESRGSLRIEGPDPIVPAREFSIRLGEGVKALEGVGALEGARLLDLAKCPDGAYLAVHEYNGRILPIRAKAVILATGGAANAYIRSDNPAQLTCDGHGIALKMGLPLVDMEFVQFFPLGLAEEGRPALMIPFAKGRLSNRLGEDIIAKYGLGDLGAALRMKRDMLSRCIMLEVAEGRGAGGALLIHPEPSDDHLSISAFELMRRFNLRPPIRVLPTAHYTMGGVEVDERLRTALPGLYVVGELMGGAQGANRLGGNALAACATLSRLVAADVARYLEEFGEGPAGAPDPAMIRGMMRGYGPRDGSIYAEELRLRARRAMWERVGVLRSEEGLKEAIDELSEALGSLDKAKIRGLGDLVALREAESTLLASLAIARSALERRESRGSHFRLDHPEERPDWAKKAIRVRYAEGEMKCEIAPIS